MGSMTVFAPILRNDRVNPATQRSHMRIGPRQFLVTIALAALSGCGSSTQPSGPGNGPLTAKLDGAAWSATNVVATYPSGILAVAGTDAQGRTIGFAIGPTTATGTFAVGPTSGVNASLTEVSGSSVQSWHAVQTSGSGSVTLTTITPNHAVGTFQFTVVPVPEGGATGTRAITQGAFDVTY